MASIPFFAWVDSIEDEPFDPAVHARRDLRIMKVVRSQSETGFATLAVDVKVPEGGTPAGARNACHVSTRIDGQVRWLFSGEIVKADVARKGEVATIEFQAVDADLDGDERRLLAAVRSSSAYVPELSAPNDDLDATAILAHTDRQLEYDCAGRAMLVPIFGDPTKFRQIPASRVLDYEPDVGGMPARGTLVTLNLQWTERRPVEKSLGRMVQDAIDLKASKDLFAPTLREFLKKADPNGSAALFSPFVVLEATDFEGNKTLSAIRLDYYETYAEAQDALDRYVPDPGFTVRRDLSAITAGGSEPTANWTMTPDVIDSWPKDGATLGDDFFVLRSAMIAVDGPGAKKTSNNGVGGEVDATYGIKIDQLSENTHGLPEDPADYKGLYTATDVDGTVFSDPLLDVFGILSQERREVFQVYVPNGCQTLRRGNGPVKYVNLTAEDIGEDKSTDPWEENHDYYPTDRVLFAGIVWTCDRAHRSSTSLFADMIQTDINSPIYGERVWYPLADNGSPLGRSDVERSLNTEFGRRCYRYAVARGCASNAWEMRQVSGTARVDVDIAWDLDTSWTVEIAHKSLKRGRIQGKVTSIELVFDGTAGVAYANVGLVSAIGSYDPATDPGDPDPVDPVSEDPDDGHGYGPGRPDPLIPLASIDWETTAPINWYDIAWEDAPDDYDYSQIDSDKLFFDYDRDGVLDMDDTDDDGIPGEDPEDGDDGEEEIPTEDVAVTGDARWARVKYKLPFYVPPSIDLENIAKVDVQWLGYDQCRAMTRPGTVYPPGSLAGRVYVYGEPVDDFLEDEATTKITVDISNQTAGADRPQTSFVQTSPFLGPRQVEL